MDEVTQQNAALVQEAATAAASLEEQAAQLESAVATFKLADGENRGSLPIGNSVPKAVPSIKQARPTRGRAPSPKVAEVEWEAF